MTEQTMSSPMHRHNPYQQALPAGYQTVPVDHQVGASSVSYQQHQPQQPYYPDGVEVHTQRQRGTNFSHGAQHGYHAQQHEQQYQQPQYQQQYSTYNYEPGFNSHNQQPQDNSEIYSGNHQPGCEVDLSCGVPVAACFPSGVMDKLIDTGMDLAKGGDDEDEAEDDCGTHALQSCIAPSHTSNQHHHGRGGRNNSAPPVYSDFSTIQKTTTQYSLQAGGEEEEGDRTEGEDDSGSIVVTKKGEATPGGVMKTSEKVVRTELNGRVPYIHFPPVAEMVALVNEAKQQLVLDDEEKLLRNPAMVGPDGKLKKNYFPVFFGQVIFSTTQTHLNWLLLHLIGLIPTAVSNHSPGCFTCYFTTMTDCNSVLSLNKRLLFDNDGIWVAQNPTQTDLVFKSVNQWRAKQQANNAAAIRLPRGAMVVELPMHGGGSGGGGARQGNHNHRGGNRGVSRMR